MHNPLFFFGGSILRLVHLRRKLGGILSATIHSHLLCDSRAEPGRDCRRLHTLRGCSHGNVTRFALELYECAVRLLGEHEQEHPSRWAPMKSIAEKIGCSAETLRSWVRQAERDTGQQTGTMTADLRHMKDLGREVRELHRQLGPIRR